MGMALVSAQVLTLLCEVIVVVFVRWHPPFHPLWNTLNSTVMDLRDSVSVAIQEGFKDLVIEGDNLIVIGALKGNIHIPWQLENIIKDVQAWLTQSL